MNQLQIFKHEQFGNVRTVILNGEIWFVAADVCRALEHSNVTSALERLDDDERSKLNLGRQGETNIVNEPGLYALILGLPQAGSPRVQALDHPRSAAADS